MFLTNYFMGLFLINTLNLHGKFEVIGNQMCGKKPENQNNNRQFYFDNLQFFAPANVAAERFVFV